MLLAAPFVEDHALWQQALLFRSCCFLVWSSSWPLEVAFGTWFLAKPDLTFIAIQGPSSGGWFQFHGLNSTSHKHGVLHHSIALDPRTQRSLQPNVHRLSTSNPYLNLVVVKDNYDLTRDPSHRNRSNSHPSGPATALPRFQLDSRQPLWLPWLLLGSVRVFEIGGPSCCLRRKRR